MLQTEYNRPSGSTRATKGRLHALGVNLARKVLSSNIHQPTLTSVSLSSLPLAWTWTWLFLEVLSTEILANLALGPTNWDASHYKYTRIIRAARLVTSNFAFSGSFLRRGLHEYGRGIRWRIFTTIWLEARWRTTVVPNGSASSIVNRQKLVIERLS